MRAGKLDRTITIQRVSESVSAAGSVSKTWADLETPRSEILQQSASEFLTGYGEAENGTIIFRIRYRPGITTADRVSYAGKIYDIEEIKEIGRRRSLELRGVSTT